MSSNQVKSETPAADNTNSTIQSHGGSASDSPLSVTTKPAAPDTRKLYFGYGSNLWLNQMERRCPDNKLIGLGILRGWKWFVNTRGWANVVRSQVDCVYGLVYEISPSDEEKLDKYECVHEGIYTRETVEIELQSTDKEVVGCSIYIDDNMKEDWEAGDDYIYRMNMGINDAKAIGLPEWYIEDYMRRFIPVPKEKAAEPEEEAKPEEGAEREEAKHDEKAEHEKPEHEKPEHEEEPKHDEEALHHAATDVKPEL